MNTMNRVQLSLLSLCVLALVFLSFTPGHFAAAGTGAPLTGYAWSDGIGWVSMHGTIYGINAGADGTLSGYAWSDTVGWISANSADLTGCPSGTCTARISGGALLGWLRVIARDGSWDGFISLSGTAPNYGPTLDQSGNFSGYAWGDKVVGWLDFSRVSTAFTECTPSYSCSGNTIMYTDVQCHTSSYSSCTSPAFCSAGSSTCLYPPPSYNQGGQYSGHLEAVPQVVPQGITTTVHWNVSNVSECTVHGTNGDSWSGTTGTHTSQPIESSVVYTLTCPGLDGSNVNESVTVNIIPTFEER